MQSENLGDFELNDILNNANRTNEEAIKHLAHMVVYHYRCLIDEGLEDYMALELAADLQEVIIQESISS